MSEIIDQLRIEHTNLARIVNALERQLKVFDAGGAPDYELVQAVVEYALAYPDRYHHPKEDLIEDRMREKDPEGTAQLVNLHEEHKSLAAVTRRLAEVIRTVLGEGEMLREVVAFAMRQFIDSHREHMRMEEQMFFPAALSALNEADWAALDARAENAPDPIFGGLADPRFVRLIADIREWDEEDAKAGLAGG